MTSAGAQAAAAPKPPAILKVVLLMPFLQAELRSCTRQRWLHFLARRWHLMGRLAGAINRLPVRLQEVVIAFFVAGMDKDAVRVVRLLLSRPCVENAFYMANCEASWHMELRHAFCVDPGQRQCVATHVQQMVPLQSLDARGSKL
ncbi:uncharacterized protein HaLaN_02156, partial [Haematococcus lacustris]